MPKKTGATRTSAQRNRTRNQRSFELIQPEGQTRETVSLAEEVIEKPVAVATPKKVTPVPVPASPASSEPDESEEKIIAPKGSAAARMAARRRTLQKDQQRNAASLITAEHFAYVKKDLITIGVLASIMFVTIIVLYFTIGRM